MNNSSTFIHPNLTTPTSTTLAPWLLLFGRTLLFITLQALFALGFFLAGSASAWEQSANWWPLVVALVNLICLTLLIPLYQAEGKRFWDLFRIERQHLLGDLLVMLGLTALIAPVSYFPNVWLGTFLFGDSAATLDLIVRPLPMWGVYAAIIMFPLTQGLAEAPIYFGYIMPRLIAQSWNKWIILGLTTLMLAFQHVAIPLLFDMRFIAWRALMFMPFAFLIGAAMLWRPRILPYFAILHGLMNLAFTLMFLDVAY